jgi:hypothetical protein
MRRYLGILLSSMLLGLCCLQCQQSVEPHEPRTVESSESHAVVGKWETGHLAIRFYDDGLVSMHGVSARWRAIDETSVRIEFEQAIMEFTVSSSSTGGLTGTLSQGGQKLNATYRKSPAPNPGPQADG